MLSAWMVAGALAAPFVLDVSEPIDTEIGGTWTRAFPNGDDGWWFVFGAGGRMNVLPMGDDLVVEDRGRISLDGEGLADTNVVQCPDGSFILGGSASLEAPDDAGYAWRYDPAWTSLGGGLLDQDSDAMHNDMALICREELTGLAFMGISSRTPFIITVDETGAGVDTFELPESLPLIGGSLLWDEWTGELLTVSTEGPDPQSLIVHRYALTDEPEATLLGEVHTPRLDIGRLWWPQSSLRIGDHWVVSLVGEDDRDQFDQDVGDIFLGVFDADWDTQELVRLTTFDGAGAMRPGLALKGDQLLVTYDRDLRHHMTAVTLDLDAFGDGVPDTPDDSGWDTAEIPDTAITPPVDSGPTGGDPSTPPAPVEGGCGCAASPRTPGLPWWLALGAALFSRSTRSRRPPPGR